MRDVDRRRFLMEQAVNIANVQNAKKPRAAVRSGYRAIEKGENKIIHRQGSHGTLKPNLEILNKINQAFGGDVNV